MRFLRPSSSAPSPSPDPCSACPLEAHGRRAFLGHLGATLGSTFLAIGIPARTARALAAAVQTLTPLPTTGAPANTKTYPIPAADGAQIDRDNEVILVRWLGSVFAFALSCPHQNTALKWNEREGHFQCPKHHSEYAADGYFIEGRATRGMDRYVIRRDGNTVVVDLSTIKKQDADQAGWEAACVVVNPPSGQASGASSRQSH